MSGGGEKNTMVRQASQITLGGLIEDEQLVGDVFTQHVECAIGEIKRRNRGNRGKEQARRFDCGSGTGAGEDTRGKLK